MPPPEVTSAQVRQAILAAREKAPGVAKKLTYCILFVFRWGIAEGHCATNPSVSQALALPRAEKKVDRRKARPFNKVHPRSHPPAQLQRSGAKHQDPQRDHPKRGGDRDELPNGLRRESKA